MRYLRVTQTYLTLKNKQNRTLNLLILKHYLLINLYSFCMVIIDICHKKKLFKKELTFSSFKMILIFYFIFKNIN